MLRRVRYRAAKRGIPFALTPDDVWVPDRCPVLGIPLAFGGRSYDERCSSPSLDRVRPEQGYIPGNVVVVSTLANAVRNLATAEQIGRVASFYGQLIEEITDV